MLKFPKVYFVEYNLAHYLPKFQYFHLYGTYTGFLSYCADISSIFHSVDFWSCDSFNILISAEMSSNFYYANGRQQNDQIFNYCLGIN